ncbi:MAG: hypothetical protein KJN79_09595, partial [Gammaproteobacteria bacterium]|nr:hypothetical protein [Gammaproteobacteria bacterium]
MTNPVSRTAAIKPPTRATFCLAIFLIFICSPLFASDESLAHDLSVVIHPDSGEITVADEIRIDRNTPVFEFVLNSGLSVATESGNIEALETSGDGLRTAYRVTLKTPGTALKLQYHGPLKFSARRSLGGMPQGVVSAQGVYLDRASAWYPLFDRDFDTLSMSVKLPDGWQSVSIGKRAERRDRVIWTTTRPHDDLYLIAGPFSRHARQDAGIDLSVWLLDDDPALAAHYLDLMSEYIRHYSRLIGDYPYAKFAVVENRWQTGFGMPSFTLLGSRVIRLPFIPYTSLPHEILHNWWGNGVWIDYEKGNWSEGLTAYLADHWMKERRGKGGQYRLQALQRYSNFAAEKQDMPLLAFVSRHSDASQSIGYSKSLMLFHMLRQAQGDAEFRAGLQRLWQRHRYSRIGFRQAVETIAGADTELADRFQTWLEREGAPRLNLDNVNISKTRNGYLVQLALSQDQDPPFVFDLPVAITLAGEDSARSMQLRVDKQQNRFDLDFTQRPLRIDIDPEYDVLRYLDPSEQPPALNRLFGGDSWLVLPTAAPKPMRDAWQDLARQWKKRYPGLRTIADTEAPGLDPRSNSILLGWDNRLFSTKAKAFEFEDQALEPGRAVIGGRPYPAEAASVVLVSNDPQGISTGFIGADSPQAIETLARKLTHYGSYGRLVFGAETGGNLRKDHLRSRQSQLSRQSGDAPVPL